MNTDDESALMSEREDDEALLSGEMSPGEWVRRLRKRIAASVRAIEAPRSSDRRRYLSDDRYGLTRQEYNAMTEEEAMLRRLAAGRSNRIGDDGRPRVRVDRRRGVAVRAHGIAARGA